MTKLNLTKLGLAAVLALGATAPALANEGGMPPANTKVGNIPAVQRGARLYFNYCIGCHSLKYMMYSRMADDLGLSEDQVRANLSVPGAKIGDYVRSTMPADGAQAWFGKAPPDLSLEARAKGPDWIYNYLKSFYIDPARPVGWNNTVFPGASMPNVLWELQGVQHAEFAAAKPGEDARVEKLVLAQPGRQSAQEFDETARDITTFLQYVGEPAALQREKLGVWVVLYLAFFTLIAYALKKEFWKDVH